MHIGHIELSFGIERRETAHLLHQGVGFASGIVTLVLGRFTWAITWA